MEVTDHGSFHIGSTGGSKNMKYYAKISEELANIQQAIETKRMITETIQDLSLLMREGALSSADIASYDQMRNDLDKRRKTLILRNASSLLDSTKVLTQKSET